jgi:hypothetical protein
VSIQEEGSQWWQTYSQVYVQVLISKNFIKKKVRTRVLMVQEYMYGDGEKEQGEQVRMTSNNIFSGWQNSGGKGQE